MNMLERHLNWAYGVALIISVGLVIGGIISGNVAGYIAYIIIVYIGAGLVLWRKNRLNENKFYYLILFPPILAIAVLYASNERSDEIRDKLKKLGL